MNGGVRNKVLKESYIFFPENQSKDS